MRSTIVTHIHDITLPRCSLQLVAKPVPEPEALSNADRPDMRSKPDCQVCVVLLAVRDYMKFLLVRTYSIVIVLALLFLLSTTVVWPYNFHLFSFSREEIVAKIVKLDLYFVPVFWLLMDQDVFHFTKEYIKKQYSDLMLKFE